jgi:hypothetical protein
MGGVTRSAIAGLSPTPTGATTAAAATSATVTARSRVVLDLAVDDRERPLVRDSASASNETLVPPGTTNAAGSPPASCGAGHRSRFTDLRDMSRTRNVTSKAKLAGQLIRCVPIGAARSSEDQ